MNIKKTIKALSGCGAAAYAMRQINPDVVSAYPITPQTPIIEEFAQFVADGVVDTEMISVESEHSALSAAVGASASGARAMTATCSAGFALMWEILGVASGMRLPIVMHVANRALSGPINIHCDHSDSMGGRDLGWIQIYSEDAQEAYENTFLAVRLSEHPEIMLPAMVMQDGFITGHAVVNVEVLPDSVVQKFVGEYKLKYSLLDIKNPVTLGPLELPDSYFETAKQREDAILKAKEKYLEIGRDLSNITGRNYPLFEIYEGKTKEKFEDSEMVIIALNSTAGTAKAVVDELRSKGKKVGLLKPRLFRPFPYEEIANALASVPKIAVLDRSYSFGGNAPLYGEVKNAVYDLSSNSKPQLQSYVFGLGGRDIFERDIKQAFDDLERNSFSRQIRHLNLHE